MLFRWAAGSAGIAHHLKCGYLYVGFAFGIEQLIGIVCGCEGGCVGLVGGALYGRRGVNGLRPFSTYRAGLDFGGLFWSLYDCWLCGEGGCYFGVFYVGVFFWIAYVFGGELGLGLPDKGGVGGWAGLAVVRDIGRHRGPVDPGPVA